MIVSGYAYREYELDDDDDFEEKYIISGPTLPGKFKSGHPDAFQTKEILK